MAARIAAISNGEQTIALAPAVTANYANPTADVSALLLKPTSTTS